MIRARNEEKTIFESITSLFSLSIPCEFIIILHCCTDRSEEIVRALRDPRIRIYVYDQSISRAGYENLATDMKSSHSMVHYDNWCFSKATMPWVFKWDADFVATPELLSFLQSKQWEYSPGRFCINAKNSTSKNGEFYLACGQKGFTKYLFWEVALYTSSDTTSHSVHVDPSICIRHCSELSEMKSYWSEEPWYNTEISEEATLVKERIQKLVADFGPEPPGMARASNPECDSVLTKIRAKKPSYVNIHW